MVVLSYRQNARLHQTLHKIVRSTRNMVIVVGCRREAKLPQVYAPMFLTTARVIIDCLTYALTIHPTVFMCCCYVGLQCVIIIWPILSITDSIEVCESSNFTVPALGSTQSKRGQTPPTTCETTAGICIMLLC